MAKTPALNPKRAAASKHSASPKPKLQVPDWKKKLHHVVPVSWQAKFSSPRHPGRPYYSNLITGQKIGPIGPGRKMAVKYANILFDPRGFPTDQLEDQLANEEAALMPALERVLSSGCIEQSDPN